MQKTLPRDFDPETVVRLLSPLLSERRKERIEDILSIRTRYITVVLYDLYHQHNMSAVVRSLEAFGIQDCHVIEVENRFDPSHGVSLGAQQWITIKRYSSASRCINDLRERGFRVLAADPPDKAFLTKDKRALDIKDIKLEEGPVAILFGKELDGLNDELRCLCDSSVYIPMLGFTESLNVSVTAAICLYELRRKLDGISSVDWHLTPDEKRILRAKWYLQSVKHGEKVLHELMKRAGRA